MVTSSVCDGIAFPLIVVRTVYSLGVSGDHSVTPVIPGMVRVATWVPAVIDTVRCTDPSRRVPSSRSAVIFTWPFLCTRAASMVAWTSTLGLALSTPVGFANTSERNTSGTTLSATSR